MDINFLAKLPDQVLLGPIDGLAVCQAHRGGLPVGFQLLWYSVWFTDESLSLLYLIFYILIYMFYEMVHW